MKSTHTTNPFRIALVAGASLFIAGMMTAQAASTFITFSVDMSAQIGTSFTPGTDTIEAHGTFNGWGALNLVQVGSSTVYTNTINDTTDANAGQMQYKFVIDGNNYENTATGQNRVALLPATSGASLALPTSFFDDAGPAATNNVTFQVDLSQQINLGIFTNNSTSFVTVAGLLNGWNTTIDPLTNDPTILRTNQFGLVTSNVYVGTFPVAGSPGSAEAFKFVINNGTTDYEGPDPVNSDNGGNRYYANVAQTLPVVYFSDSPFAPIAQIGFSVDMSAVALSANGFQTNSVQVDGSFNGWGAPVICVNTNPASPYIYYSPTVSIGEGSTFYYQFRYTNNLAAIVYDNAPGGGNRTYTVPIVSATNLPTVYFNNVLPTDVLNEDTEVTFSVNMTNAVAVNNSPGPFDPSSDGVFINGDFIGWLNWDPISLGNYELTATPPTSEIYSITSLFAKGSPRLVNYKYSINGVDNEAGANLNHVRYIRSTNGVYQMPLDTFGNQYIEPKIGGLTVGSPSGAQLPISWLPYPTAVLQSSTDLSSGIWVDDTATLGAGSTNWPISGGSVFFRLKGQ